MNKIAPAATKRPSPSVKRPTVTASVADEIRRRIISGEYEGGEQIRQEAIATELGVSRIPVREALLQLESEGLVVIHTHKGAIVAALTREDAIDLLEARLAIEPMLIRKAIAMATPADITHVQSWLAEYEKSLNRNDDATILSDLNWKLHTAMYAPANRTRQMAILETLYTAADRYMRLQIRPITARAGAMEDHRQLYEAYRKKDADAAEGLLRAHITRAFDDILNALQTALDNHTS